MGSSPGSERSPGGGNATRFSILAGEPHRQRSLAGPSPQGHKESDTPEATARMHTGGEASEQAAWLACGPQMEIWPACGLFFTSC